MRPRSSSTAGSSSVPITHESRYTTLARLIPNSMKIRSEPNTNDTNTQIVIAAPHSHGQAEHDREQDHGEPRFDRAGTDAEQAAQPVVLEHGDGDPSASPIESTLMTCF